MLYLVLMRGLPGSGKTTLANKIAKQKDADIFSTDDFWLCPDGHYRFDPERLMEAHKWNQDRCEKALKARKSVIVDNCNISIEYMQPYIGMAARYNAKISKVVAPLNDKDLEFLFYNGRHSVPYHIIEHMKQQWEDE